MQTTTIEPLRKYGIIVRGDIETAKTAAAKHIGHRGLYNAARGGYGNTHADVYADRAQIEAWFAREDAIGKPGELLFYIGK